MSLNKKFGSQGILVLSQQLSNVTHCKVFFHLAHLVSSVVGSALKLAPHAHTMAPQFQASHNNTSMKKGISSYSSIFLFFHKDTIFQKLPTKFAWHHLARMGWATNGNRRSVTSGTSWGGENINKRFSRKFVFLPLVPSFPPFDNLIIHKEWYLGVFLGFFLEGGIFFFLLRDNNTLFLY